MEKHVEDSPLWKHSVIHHEEQKSSFEMQVTGVHRTAMGRLCDKIIRIKTSNSKVLLNSKNDWAQPALIRVTTAVGNSQETQVGDSQPSRQERREAARAQQGTPQRRRRRRAASPATTTPVRAAPDAQQQQEDRQSRRARRGL
jgi:hypothetical protein